MCNRTLLAIVSIAILNYRRVSYLYSAQTVEDIVHDDTISTKNIINLSEAPHKPA
jgi:hypothetical protein